MPKIQEWLASLGLSEYADRFVENDIDISVLCDLTDQHLKDLGVSLGHRLKMLRAIRELDEASPATPSPAADSRPSPLDSAERRQLTVMFCDLVGSTSLSVGRDPEDLRELISRYQRAVAETVQREGGFVAKYMGDGLLVYFGWPRADEADAERAARAGLAVVEAIRANATPGPRFSVRIGIATGLAVVGDLIGEGAAREQAVIGETPNLAARLQSAAEPDTVVIDSASHTLIGTMFECRSIGPLHLKGWQEPVPAWTVEAAAAVQSRSEALYGRALTPLIGRDDELDLLLRRWHSAIAGEGQAVLISGEAGIGKSRLIAELEHRLASKNHEVWHYFCSPHQQDTPLHPVAARWERVAGFTRSDSSDERLHKLQAAMGAGTSAEDVSLIADLLNLPAEGRLKLDFSPQRRRERTFALLMRLLIDYAESRPVLMLVEDAHWADASSIELFDQMFRALPSLRVLLVMSFRPDYHTPWIGQAGVALIALSRLTQRQATTVAAQIIRDHAMPAPLLERVVAQADGVPLFIEELTRTVLERGGRDDAALTVPATLQASLMARLDRVPVAKQVAQIASVIGREVPHSLLGEVARVPDSVLRDGLTSLVEAGLMFRRGVSPDICYMFKHALVQDAAYESLLRSRRAEIHGAVAAALARDPETSADAAALIGHHFAQGGQIELAANWYRRAGQHSADRSAITETKAQFQRGLQLVASLPDNMARKRLEVELQLALGRMLAATGGNANPEAKIAFDRASTLCRTIDEPEMLAQAIWGKLTVIGQYEHVEEGRRVGEELLAVAGGNERIEVVARLGLGIMDVWAGRFNESRRHLEFVLDQSEQLGHVRLNLANATSPDRIAAAFLSNALAVQGYANQAVLVAADAVQRAHAAEDDSLAAVLSVSARTMYCLGEDRQLAKYARAAFEFSERKGIAQWDALARTYNGWIAVRAGDRAQGLSQIDEAQTTLKQRGMILSRAAMLNLFAECLLLDRRRQDALAILDEALDISAATGIELMLAETYRLKGDALLSTDATAAVDQLHVALAVAHRQEARLWELRAALSLARHMAATGRTTEAVDLLDPICNWFDPTVTFETLDGARALLEQIAG